MIKPRILFIVPVIVFLLSGCSSSNRTTGCFYQTAVNQSFLPDIAIDPVNFEENGMPRLDILLQIPYHHLRFMKSGDNFEADYSVSVQILGDGDAQVKSVDWTKTITLSNYRETTSDHSDATIRAFPLPEGKYTIVVTIQDEQSQQRREVRRTVTLRPAGQELTASDIVILQRLSESVGIKVITPMLPSDIRKVKSFSTFMEVYDSTKSDTIRVRTQLIPFTLDIDRYMQSSPYVFQPFIPDAKLFAPRYDSTAIEHDTTLVSDAIPTQLFTTFSTPKPGRYQLVSLIIHKKPDRIDTLFYGRILNVRSEFFPEVTDVDNLIGPLRYVLKKVDFDSLDAPGTPEERMSRLDQIWKSTLNPALRQDFYTRVQQANDYFTTFVDGWRTPMGMVYIVAGPPGDVNCQGMRAESWLYDYQQSSAIFLFQTNPASNGSERPYYMLTGYPRQDAWDSFVSRWR